MEYPISLLRNYLGHYLLRVKYLYRSWVAPEEGKGGGGATNQLKSFSKKREMLNLQNFEQVLVYFELILSIKTFLSTGVQLSEYRLLIYSSAMI